MGLPKNHTLLPKLLLEAPQKTRTWLYTKHHAVLRPDPLDEVLKDPLELSFLISNWRGLHQVVLEGLPSSEPMMVHFTPGLCAKT